MQRLVIFFERAAHAKPKNGASVSDQNMLEAYGRMRHRHKYKVAMPRQKHYLIVVF
jgi:hypothetical protein